MAAFASSSHPSSGKRKDVIGQPEYQIANLDLSQEWIDLVQQNQIQTRVNFSVDDDAKVGVNYGVRLSSSSSQAPICQEFAIQEEGPACERIQIINQTLSDLQNYEESSASSSTVKYVVDGDFVGQLQLVRTLRPPPSPGFSESITCISPPYNSETDSFVTGPLRLELRPLVGTVSVDGLTTTGWDVFHNVSPVDTRGHFLLIPTLSERKQNWRGQIFTPEDCHDLVYLADSVRPFGSLLLGFNSVGAGASQNHIHCHAWPSPPLPLLMKHRQQLLSKEYDKDNEIKGNGWNCYAVSKVKSISDFYDINDGKIECSYLKYPVFCVQLSASTDNLGLLAKALAACLESVCEAPYNIGMLNRPEEDGDESYVDVFLFVRSKERSEVLPALKLGISEMMGLFHAQSDSELELLVDKNKKSGDKEGDGPMSKALVDVSFEDEEYLWTSIKENLMKLDDSSL
jgi:hypothetical protein